MVDIFDLKEGDKIKVVSRWVEPRLENSDGSMNKYLGQTLTVSRIVKTHMDFAGYFGYVQAKEDDGRWAWFANMIESVNHPSDDDEPESLYEVSDEEFASLFAT